VYFYRQYKPTVAVRDNNLRLASTEFEAVLHLQPGQSDALRYGKQIELGQNFLGLAANLDLDPRFDEYLTRYASFATFISVFYSQGINLLIAGEAERIAELQKSLDIGRISTETNYATADRDAALSGVDAADETVKDVDGRLTQINARIKEALAKVPDSSISIGTVLTTVGIVAAAVGSVIAAVPTAGASLYALVPSLSGLAVQFSQIGGRLFEATDVEKTALKDKYEKVGKNFEAVGKGVTSVVNLVQAMQKLTDGRTPGNAEVVDLMRQGVQLAHELLVAKLRKEQADLTVIARQIQVGGSTEAAKLATAQLAQLVNGERIFVAAGRSAIRATQRKIDTILEVSFRAQRSIEIYTFRDRPGIISFDTGFIHPDIEASFDDGELAISDLVRKYSESFLPLLDPLDLQNDFDHYFTSDAKFELVPGVYLASIRDAASLAAFRTSQTGTRSASLLVDVPELPANQLEMKIERVSVALVGASSTGPALNCTVQHGGIYLLRGRDASAVTQQLSPHITQANPQFVSFQSSRPPPSTGAQGEARARTDHLWGRGVGGQWLVTVDDKDLQANGVDLTGLTEIQLWIETQAFVAVTTHK
jgi:hypothetical protein